MLITLEVILTPAMRQTVHCNRTKTTGDLSSCQLIYRHRVDSSCYKYRNKLFHIDPSSTRNWRNLSFRVFSQPEEDGIVLNSYLPPGKNEVVHH